MIEQPLHPVAGLTGSDSYALCPTLNLLQKVIPRTEINEGERLIWLWMVIHCVQARSTSCCFSYQDLADVLVRKIDSIHRALHRLRLMGYLIAEVPFLHGVVTQDDGLVERIFTPTLPEHEQAVKRQIEINLIREQMAGTETGHYTKYS